MEITGNYQTLAARANSAALMAHAPYSKFHVGAAVLCTNGQIVTGSNIENASYGLTVCAERVALFSAAHQGFKPVTLAVTCLDAGDDAPIEYRMPCGACRQVMVEFMDMDSEIVIVGTNKVFRLVDLLPNAFKI